MAIHTVGIFSALGRLATIDARSLAIYRIGLGILLFVDALDRLRDLEGHYSEVGVLPIAALQEWIGWRAFLSIYSWSSSEIWAAMLLVTAATAGLAVAFGWWTRPAMTLSWFLLCAVHLRNPAIVDGGGNLLRVLTFWSLFLPLGQRWSLDARAGPKRGTQVTSLATFAILAQITVVYWTTAGLKLGEEWLGGSAVEMALRLDHLSTGWGRLLLNYPELLRLATYATLILEFAGPLLAWLPFWGGRLRFSAALAMILFHLVALQAALSLGLFPWTAAVAWLLFLPTWFWENTRWREGDEFESARAPFHERSSAPARWVIVAALVLTAWLNVQALGRVGGYVLEPPRVNAVVEPIANFTGLSQRWRMFAPPPGRDGWFVMPGRTLQGEVVDVWRRSELDWSKPDPVGPTFGSSRWNKYLSNLAREEYSGLRPHLLRYLCHRWRSENDQARWLEGVQVHYMEEVFRREDEGATQQELLSRRCDAQ